MFGDIKEWRATALGSPRSPDANYLQLLEMGMEKDNIVYSSATDEGLAGSS